MWCAQVNFNVRTQSRDTGMFSIPVHVETPCSFIGKDVSDLIVWFLRIAYTQRGMQGMDWAMCMRNSFACQSFPPQVFG